MRNLAPGSRLGRFEIVSVLGEGAMGVVYLANDGEIERSVAIKTLRALSEASPEARGDLEARFLKEAKLAGRLQHPNVVTVYDVGRDQDLPFIAMEYVEGESLSRAARGLNLAARLEIVRQVAQALQHAHERGVLHRDIKPGNILVTADRRVKVADFGIGKLLSSGTGDLTRTGQMLGSPAYMSPEQIRGEKLDGRSDLFSLGVVFYELLTGSRPFPGDSITTLVYQILHTEPRDPLELRADLPPATRDVFARLLAKAPDKRPADAADFLREIRKIESELQDVEPTQALTLGAVTRTPAATHPASTPSARPTPPRPAPPAPAPGGRSAGPLYLFGAAALLVAVALLVWIWRASAKREERLAAAAAAPSPVATVAAAAPDGGGSAPAPELLAPTESVPPQVLPTPGPPGAADAIVGATRLEPTPVRVRPSPAPAAEAMPVQEPSEAPAPTPVLSAAAPDATGASIPAAHADNVYRTRRFAKFSGSPEQARIYVDGRYAGIVDDWDDRGGGRTLPLPGLGTHRVRLDLPGYRSVNLDVIVTPEADDETVEIDDELDRRSRIEYPKLRSPLDRTEGPVVFQVVPGDAVVSDGTRALGPVSSFGAASPLQLVGPTVHDLTLSAPGYETRVVRILVSPNAGREKAVVKVELKAAKQ